MSDIITLVILGVFCIILGILNCTGNISTLHYYHRKRVSEEDRLPFGRMVGLGTIIIGVSLIVTGILFFVSDISQQNLYLTIGNVILIVGLVTGLGLTFYAMLKYNKGIF